MNLKIIHDDVLIKNTESLVGQERELLTKVLHHLREIERRRLYSALRFRSLFDFTVRRLGYSEDEAYRRISAMRLLKEIPELEDKLSSGEISLTHITLAQSLFRHEKLSKEQKVKVFEEIANKPTREAKRITLSMSKAPQLAKPDRVNSITAEHVEIKFTASNQVAVKLKKVKSLFAHKHPHISMAELIDKLCDLALSPAAPQKRRIKKDNCQKCGSIYALEIDHIIPRAKGGTSNPENLRTLCRSCNQRAAIVEFGQKKMDRYIN